MYCLLFVRSCRNKIRIALNIIYFITVTQITYAYGVYRNEQRCTKRNNDSHKRRELVFYWSSVRTTRRWPRRYRNFTYCWSPPTRHSSTAHAKVFPAVPWLAIATCVTMSAKLAPYRRRRHDLGQFGYNVGAERRRWNEVPSAAGTLDI